MDKIKQAKESYLKKFLADVEKLKKERESQPKQEEKGEMYNLFSKMFDELSQAETTGAYLYVPVERESNGKTQDVRK